MTTLRKSGRGAVLCQLRLNRLQERFDPGGCEKEQGGVRAWNARNRRCPDFCRVTDAIRLIRVPSVSLTNWENASLPTPRPEPVLLILALLRSFASPLGCSSFLQTIQTESVSYGFRLFCVEIGTAPISTLHVRNPFFSFSLRSDFQVFSTPFNRSPYQVCGKERELSPTPIPGVTAGPPCTGFKNFPA
ncbi:hypothetical protein DESA109040_18935 [Deinococcus saxicola]